MANIENNTEQKLREILDSNNLPEMIEGWTRYSYNKEADLFEAGTNYPAGSYFFSIDDTGVMLRIDDQKKIYGFAIENVKVFLKENPQFDLPLSYFIAPARFYGYYVPAFVFYFLMYQTGLAIQTVINMKGFADYVAGRALYA